MNDETPPRSLASTQGTRSRALVSFVLPIYNEVGNIDLFHSTLLATLAERPDLEYEFVYINDGSRDRSLERLVALHASDPRVRVIDLSRNFGHQIAVTAGIDFATGDAVIIMDTDLQDPPAVCLELIARWEEGYDVAYAQRRSRQDGAFKRWTAAAYYRILRLLTDIEIPRDTGDFRLISRDVANAIKDMREQHRFIRGMVSFVGFRQVAVPFDRDARHAGTTGYPLRKMLKLAADGIMGFSSAPLKLISRVGFGFAFLSFVAIVYVLLSKWLRPETVIEGWSFTVIAMLLIGGVQMIMIGLLGGYIARIYSEVQGRPLYFVSTVHGVDRGRVIDSVRGRSGSVS